MIRSPSHRVTLDRRDMIVFEQRLRDAMASLFSFKSYSVHFPRNQGDASAAWIAAEKKLLLPLCDGKRPPLGLFVARGLSHKAVAPLIPHWPALSALIADNLLLYKRSICDPVTGLFSRHYLLRCLEREIETLRDPIRLAPPVPGTPTDPAAGSIAREAARGSTEGLVSAEGEGRRSSIGTLVVRLAALRDVVREFGYQFADELMKALANALHESCPEQAVAARTGDSEFAVHLPSATPRACRDLASAIVDALRKVYVVHPLRREQVGIAPSVGYTLYPQDMTGELFVRPSAEQARVVLRKARLASALAGENMPRHPGRVDSDAVMGFSRILAEGGRVLESLPLSRVLISLGSNVHAREGQRFSVWSAAYRSQQNSEAQSANKPLAPLYKGEIVIMEVHENISQAEVIHLGEPSWDIEAGDMLVLLPDEQGSRAPEKNGEIKLDAATGLLRHGDFLARWAEEREKTDSFALALVRLAPKGKAAQAEMGLTAEMADNLDDDTAAQNDNDSPERANASHPAHFMAQAVGLCREEMGEAIFGGRYGLNSLIFFHALPGKEGYSAQTLHSAYERTAKAIAERLNLDVAVGLAVHPYLDFRKADALENSRKALEYAMLLPRPHVGLLDSLALNISADKRFSQGDTFGAIKEYQMALLADENNGMAWNSLGICLAGLNRHAEAETHFSKALACNNNDAMALYNLGYMHQRQGRDNEARQLYRRCLEHEPDHLYAMVRLGQIAEAAANIKAARELYERAAILPGGESVTYRHFARLCVNEGKMDEAREHLHEALLYDPQDALAMSLLARLYLDAGEDPEMAATLARQSVSLRPELKSAWLQLARAMENLGRENDARDARLKAGEV